MQLHYFFFQAEDGIRDHCVTGVQTCALPISLPGETRANRRVGRERGRHSGRKGDLGPLDDHGTGPATPGLLPWRSEERRVGKECRCRWARDNSKKKEKEE